LHSFRKNDSASDIRQAMTYRQGKKNPSFDENQNSPPA